jgi:UDP-N-acetylmuramoyl-L-alanyl-D-glutamate--2,6-diaminopimelate ligase
MPEGARLLGELLDRWRGEGRLIGHAHEAGAAPGEPPIEAISITGVSDDSRTVAAGNLFVAVRGLTVDGHDYIAAAAERGAVAAAVEEPIRTLEIPQVVVEGGAAALASAAAWWHGDPSRELLTVGVTGTNGKTTTSFLAQAGLEAAGLRTGLVGTIGIRVAGELRRNEEPNTTPGALDLQRLLREMRDAREEAVVIETSSHGLAADRVASVDYDAAIFTNLSHEHLDFHKTFEAYRDAKLSLFSRLPREAKGGRPGVAVLNLDDPNVDAFIEAARRARVKIVTYGATAMADVRLGRLAADASKSTFEVAIDGRPPLQVVLPRAGRYNGHNALAVLALAHGWGLDLEAIVAAFAAFPGVPGRMEVIDRGQPFAVVVDYAHTPKSIEAVAGELRALVEPKGGSVVSVFGASGGRDVGKRPLMGDAAVRHSRLTIVTEDDSRTEDPAAIYEQVAVGAEAAGGRRGENLLVIGDRRDAIAEAFRRANPGDVVLIAGKGHETWNMGPNGPEPWSDRDTAIELLTGQ